MKFALVIPDGVADEPQAVLGGKTPLQAAEIPNMDEVARRGIVGRADHVPHSMPSGSDVGTMSLFGYDPLEFHTGRAPLEAAAQGIELGATDWCVRCNFVTIDDGRMASFTADQTSQRSCPPSHPDTATRSMRRPALEILRGRQLSQSSRLSIPQFASPV